MIVLYLSVAKHTIDYYPQTACEIIVIMLKKGDVGAFSFKFNHTDLISSFLGGESDF